MTITIGIPFTNVGVGGRMEAPPWRIMEYYSIYSGRSALKFNACLSVAVAARAKAGCRQTTNGDMR